MPQALHAPPYRNLQMQTQCQFRYGLNCDWQCIWQVIGARVTAQAMYWSDKLYTYLKVPEQSIS